MPVCAAAAAAPAGGIECGALRSSIVITQTIALPHCLCIVVACTCSVATSSFVIPHFIRQLRITFLYIFIFIYVHIYCVYLKIVHKCMALFQKGSLFGDWVLG